MTNPLPMNILESHALAQRKQLQRDVAELKSTLTQKLDARKMARTHLWQASGAAALLGLFLGYGLTGIFVRK